MDDQQIISLYHERKEQAIIETSQKYGSYCYTIAMNLLGSHEDAEECVNDTYLAVWNRIPPEWPRALKTFLAAVVRNISINTYRKNHAKKRYSGMEVMLSELDDCVPAFSQVEETIESKELSRLISVWLDKLSDIDCALFVRRYWHGDSVSALAAECGCRPEKVTQRMLRLRRKLRAYLEAEGVKL